MPHIVIPNYILVGHAAAVVFAAKNTIRMAALTGRLRYHNLPWGMVVNTKDLTKHYVLQSGYSKLADGQISYNPLDEKVL